MGSQDFDDAKAGGTGGPLLSAKGEPVVLRPGWTPDQSKLYQDVCDRAGPVSKAYLRMVPEKNQELGGQRNTPEAHKQHFHTEFSKHVSGMLPGFVDTLNQIENHPSPLADAEWKKGQSQKFFEMIKNADRTYTEIQQAAGISNDGVRKLPFMTEAQSKDYADLTERARETMDGVGKALDKKSPVVLGGTARNNAGELGKTYDDLLKVPKRLETVYASNLDPAEKQAQAAKLIESLSGVDKQIDGVQNDLESAPKKGLMHSIRSYGSKAVDAIASLPDRFRSKPVEKPMLDLKVEDPAKDREAKTVAQKAAGPQLDEPKHVTPQHDTPQHGVSQPVHGAPTPAHDPITPGANGHAQPGQHLTVESGEQGHEMKKGLGFAAMGKVDGVAHADGKTEIDYTVAGHHMAIKIDDAAGPGGHNPLSDAAEHLQHGDSFKMAIGRDARGGEVAELDDRSTGQTTRVRDDGRVEQKTQTQERGRGLETGR